MDAVRGATGTGGASVGSASAASRASNDTRVSSGSAGAKPALRQVDAMLMQETRLQLVLDTFADHPQPQRLGDPDDVQRHLAGRRAGADRLDEHLVDLQVVGLQRREMRQAAITGAEIIDGHLHAERADPVDHPARGGRVEEGMFGGLDKQVAGTHARQREQPAQCIDDVHRMQAAGGEIDADIAAWRGRDDPRQVRATWAIT